MACHVRVEDFAYSKRCVECLRGLPITSFYAQHGMKDGHASKCKRCITIQNNARRHQSSLPKKRATYLKTRRCPECEELPWRRPEGGTCIVCKREHDDEDLSDCRREAVIKRHVRHTV